MNRHCHYMKPNVSGNEAKILLVQRGDARADTLKPRRFLSPTNRGSYRSGRAHPCESTSLPTRMLCLFLKAFRKPPSIYS